MKTNSVAQGISSLKWENAHMGQLPNRMFMAMVNNDAHTGSIAKNPFNFKHFHASQGGIYLNEEMAVPPFKLNFTDNQYVVGYRSLYAAAGRRDTDNGFDITRVGYKSCHFIFGFNTSPTLCYGEPQEQKKNGTWQANIEFRTPLPNSANVIIYMEFNNSILVDKTRHTTKDYQKWTAIISDVYFVKIPIQGRYLKECLQKINL